MLLNALSLFCGSTKIWQVMQKKHASSQVISVIILVCGFTTGLSPASAEETYKASCRALGDGISLTSTGESVLEQRLVKFLPSGPYVPQKGQLGTCIMKLDPPGYRWVRCWKKDGKYATGTWEYPYFIKPTKAVANSVQYRDWSGACKVKL